MNSAAADIPTSTQSQRPRALKWGLALLLLIGAGITALVIAMQTYDWNRARGWIAGKASEATGRRVEIRGNLALTWVRPGPDESGLGRWIPWPQLDAEQVVLGNPDWAATPDMLSAAKLRLKLRLLPLLGRSLVFDTIEIDGLDGGLVLDARQRNNWTFSPARQDDSGAPWSVTIRRLKLEHVRLTAQLVPQKLELEVLGASMDEAPYGIGFSIRGKYRGTIVTGRGRAGSLLALAAGAQAFPIDLDLRSGKARLALTGTLSDPGPPAVFDAKLTLALHSMADIFPFTGLSLPDTPPFDTSGRLYGSRKNGIGSVAYENFSGRVGSSDLSGSLVYTLAKPRPKLSGALHSKLLRFADLGPAVGSPTAAAPAAKTGRVLPNEKFRLERLDAMDAEVDFSAGQVVKTAGIPMEKLHTHIRLNAGLLTLEPLEFGLAGGKVAGRIVLDSREADLKTRLRATLENLQMKRLAPSVPELHNSLGVINAQVDIQGQGNSVAQTLGSADGDLQLLMNHGTFSKILLEQAGLNLGNVILGKLFGDSQIKLNCLAADFGLKSGIANTRTFLLDTEDARIPMTGNINLRDEKLDLTFKPEQKSMRILSLRAPIYVKGSFAQPDVSVDKGVVAARAGGAIALGLLAPLAAVVPLIATPSGEEQTAPCKKALAGVAAARDKSQARD
ncbi:MAG: AsmA family protein [Rhodocyclaceae bacterium]|nr:AsmA family protein [Rhodocyclaceae bacterium]MBX3667043.1 AsmA family protein [Rhodocyclaceae bacterium]